MNEDFLKCDRNLVEACIKKDLLAWAAFVKKYSNLISVSIVTRLKNYNLSASQYDIDDIRQNILSSVWKDGKLETVRNRDDISYWLAIVSGNKALEYMRKKRLFEPAKHISIFEKVNEKELSEVIPSAGPGPIDELSKEEISKKIEEAMGYLTIKENLAIRLNLFYGKSYEEISGILKMPKGTVSSHIKRAKEKLRENLTDFV